MTPDQQERNRLRALELEQRGRGQQDLLKFRREQLGSNLTKLQEKELDNAYKRLAIAESDMRDPYKKTIALPEIEKTISEARAIIQKYAPQAAQPQQTAPNIIAAPSNVQDFKTEAEAIKSGIRGVVTINGRKARID